MALYLLCVLTLSLTYGLSNLKRTLPKRFICFTESGLSPSHLLPDQTPTPTRFLRNCEEMGLFQDLSKNPFDDDFRKAAEGNKLTSPASSHITYDYVVYCFFNSCM